MSLPAPKYTLVQANFSLTCDGDLERDSCYLSDVQLGEADSIAAIRIVVGCLSMLGAVSIVTRAIWKKQVWSPKVHPIFVLSLADTILCLYYLIGAGVFLRRVDSRVGCFAISLPTVILECVTVNLTVVYAFLAYASIKQKTLNNLLVRNRDEKVWHPTKSLIVYLIAWLSPIVIVMFLFGVVSGTTHLVSHANSCSCFCLPVLGNVVPYALPRDNESAIYNYSTTSLVFTYGLVLVLHYLTCFILLVIVYHKLLKYIKNMRREYENTHVDPYTYGATGTLLMQGQSKAKKRVLYFITIFVINGFFNFLLALFLMVLDGITLYIGPRVVEDPYLRERSQGSLQKFYLILLMFQSLTVPLQGFLNAIVYGWTRDDFLTVMAYTNSVSKVDSSAQHVHVERNQADESEMETSAEFGGKKFTDREVSMVQRLAGTTNKPIANRGKVKGGSNQIQSSLLPSETGFSDSEYADHLDDK